MTSENYIHQISASGRWFQLSTLDQLANIGGELQRYINAIKRNNQKQADNAFDRALELIDLSKLDPKNRTKSRFKEICLLRDLFCDAALYDGKEFSSSVEDLNKYCNQYAIAARYNK